MKKVILLLLGLCLLPTVLNLTTDYLDEKLHGELTVYRIKELPPFPSSQDFTPRAYQAMVRLEDSTGRFFCTGTVISDDYVLTAAHCLMRHTQIFPGMTSETITVSAPGQDGTGITHVKAKAAALNQRADYALVKGDFHEFSRLRIYAGNAIGDGTNIGPVVTCGYPWSAGGYCYLSQSMPAAADSMYVLVVPLYPGMSGGPVISVLSAMQGETTVVAVNSATLGEYSYVAPLIGLFETLGVEVK